MVGTPLAQAGGRRRLETLGRPYAFWLVALIAPTIVVLGPEATDRIAGALRGGAAALQPFTTFWFVSALLATTLLFAALRHLPPWLGWALTALGAALGWLAGELLASTPWSLGMALACAIYLQIGW